MRIRFLFLLLLPFLELWLMIAIGSEVGALAVIVWLIAMIFLGVNLLRYLGASSMLRAAQGMRGGAMPAQTMVDGLFKAIGAILLIIPGFITDFMALLCFIPFLRRLLFKRWLAKMAVTASARGFNAAGFGTNPFGQGPFTSAGGNVYEHQGSTQQDANKGTSGVLIDQQSETPASKEPKND
ncbi:MAG: FxsA family protein [Cellvibrio sp.]|uniref:FxsA family protein n=1 Tax=Cellvibrio sp. TaxID=1965322 RepID=UPI00319FCD00